MLARPEVNVNVDAILTVADYIEKLPTNNDHHSTAGQANSRNKVTHFSMRMQRRDVEECGTIGCIAACIYDAMNEPHIQNLPSAGARLGLGIEQFRELFTPAGWEYSNITSAQAAQVLRHLALTGQVDWSVAA